MEIICRKIGRLYTILLHHSKKFGNGSFLSFTVAIVPRILFVLHAVFSIRLLEKYLQYENIQSSSKLKLKVVWQPTPVNIEPVYTGLILLAFESIYTILVRKGHEYKHIWLSGFLYLVTQIPVICCIEYAFFQKRRAYHELTTKQMFSNETMLTFTKAPYHPDTFLNCFHLGIEVNCTEQFIKNFAELGLISVIIIGRWMLPRGELTRDQLSALLIGYVNTAADLTEFIGLHSKNSLSREKTAIIVVLSLYCISLLQFVVITTSTTYEYSENEKELIQSLSANLSYSKAQRYIQPLSAKLGRKDMMKNLDTLTTNAFRSGRRAGKRRQGIRAIDGAQSMQPVNSVQNPRQEGKIVCEPLPEESETKLYAKEITNSTANDREKMPKLEQLKKEQIEEPPRKEASSNSVRITSIARSNALQKWQANLHSSVRLHDIRRSLMEENWKQLSQTLLDMKVSKRMESTMKEESAVSKMLTKYEQDERPSPNIEAESDEGRDEDNPFLSWHRWIEMVQTETGGLLIALFLQEIPFFFTRVAFIYQYRVFDRGLIFYTTKNFFMLCFLNYRLWVATMEE